MSRSINHKLRTFHIERLTDAIKVIGPDFERFGEVFMDQLLGIPLSHAGLNSLGLPEAPSTLRRVAEQTRSIGSGTNRGCN